MTQFRGVSVSTLVLAQIVLAPAFGDTLSDPIYIANRGPLMINSGLPGSESAQLLPPGEFSLGVFMDVTSNATHDLSPNEEITLDGQSSHADLRIRYGIREKWELGIDVVRVAHNGGRWDGFIEAWHDLFALTQGDRDKQPDDRLLYNYQKDGQVLLNHRKESVGMGDLRLSAAYQISSDIDSQLAVRGGVELGTGDASDLLGSESTDVHLELVSSRMLHLDRRSLHVTGGIGILVRGDSEILSKLQNDRVGYGFIGVDVGVSESIRLKIQLNGHTSPYRGIPKELDSGSVIVTLGGTARSTRNWLFDVSVSEDIVGATPDITFQLGIRYQLNSD